MVSMLCCINVLSPLKTESRMTAELTGEPLEQTPFTVRVPANKDTWDVLKPGGKCRTLPWTQEVVRSPDTAVSCSVAVATSFIYSWRGTLKRNQEEVASVWTAGLLLTLTSVSGVKEPVNPEPAASTLAMFPLDECTYESQSSLCPWEDLWDGNVSPVSDQRLTSVWASCPVSPSTQHKLGFSPNTIWALIKSGMETGPCMPLGYFSINQCDTWLTVGDYWFLKNY